MVGDNDARAFGTYTQAGQNYGTALLWTLMLLIPVLYVNQEMVLRLGAVSGVGHARLILERFGKFWGAFSVIDLFLLNALTIVTEFIGITLALDYLGLPKNVGVLAAAAVVMIAVSTGSFRRFERFAIFLVFGSLLLLPVILLVHPPVAQLAQDFLVPKLPSGGQLSDVMLLIIAIVGTTVAPWQLFFQQSYVIDKRITPRFIRYERTDLWIGIMLVVLGAVAMMGVRRRGVRRPAGVRQFQRGGRRGGGAREICRTAACRSVRPSVDRRLHHRRLGGVALDRLRGRRRSVAKAFTAPQTGPGQGILRSLLRTHPDGRRAGPDPRHASRPADERGPDLGRSPAPERHSIPAAALQRQGCAWPLGEHARP
jgi:Natural resistance-associated macrophage protein